MGIVHITDNGKFTIFSGTEAAKVAAISMDKYMAMMSESEQDTRGMVPGLSAGAAMVGAICGVAGLGNKGTIDEENTRIKVEINNISSYPMVPTSVKTNRCDTKTAPRPIMTGDKTSIEVQADGNEGGFGTGDSFTLSIFSGLLTSLTFSRLSEQMMWQVSRFYVDGKIFDIDLDQYKEQAATAIAYQSDKSDDEEHPNVLYYFYPVKKKGTASLCFANYYPTA